MRRIVATALAVALLIPAVGNAQIAPPKPGVELPEAYFKVIKEDRTAFQMQHAWLGKAKNAKVAREAFIRERGFYSPRVLSREQVNRMAVTGTVEVPTFLVKFSNTGAAPFPQAAFQQKLFDGPTTVSAPYTVTTHYDEMSYGDLNMTGTVYDWVTAANTDTYYENGNNGLGMGPLGELMHTALNAYDGSVDFGIYDNDGPDGVPNSGDDDGFVDFVAFVHPEEGGECGTSNIWSHRWVMNAHPAGNFVTNDAAAGGGFIIVSDYVIQPAKNCFTLDQIDIGVFSHEFGHALGLPDLYDTNGGSQGVGEWDLMGSGSWQSTDNPSHMGAWCKGELGWNTIIDVGPKGSNVNIPAVEFNRTTYRLPVRDDRWRRTSTCAITTSGGSSSMHCGLNSTEASNRNWVSGEGYGNEWVERVSRDFDYSGSGTVSFAYDYDHDSESGYDFTYGRIDVGGTVSTFATYDGTATGTENVDLTPYLSGHSGPYTVFFQFESDVAWSDRDGTGGFNSTCGPFTFDNVSLNGGGETYSTDFEAYEDGWYYDDSATNEYFYVENRQPQGSEVDQNAWGLVIWHINEDVMRTGQAGNTGGSSGLLVHGVDVEQADGLNHLGLGINRGDAGDVFPGTSSKFAFSNTTVPNSLGASGTSNFASAVLFTGSGDPMTVALTGGYGSPSVATFSPVAEDNNTTIELKVWAAPAVAGTIGPLVNGATVELTDGVNTYASSSVNWVGKEYLEASIDINGAVAGTYDIVVTNPDGGCAVVTDGFQINGTATSTPTAPTVTALSQNYPNPFNPTTIIPFQLAEAGFTELKIFNIRGQVVKTLVSENLQRQAYRVSWDGTNDRGLEVSSGVYFYKLTTNGGFEDVRKLVLMK